MWGGPVPNARFRIVRLGRHVGKSNVLLGTEELDYTTQGLDFTAQAGKTNYFKVGVSLKTSKVRAAIDNSKRFATDIFQK